MKMVKLLVSINIFHSKQRNIIKLIFLNVYYQVTEAVWMTSKARKGISQLLLF